jgi:hypothetical protein
LEQDRIAGEQWARERSALGQGVVGALNNILWWAGGAVGIVIAAAGVGASVALVQSGRALGNKAMMNSKFILPNNDTGRFPMLINVQDGQYQIADPNTGMVRIVNQNCIADRHMVSAVMSMQIAYSTAHQASRAKLPHGVRASYPQDLEVIDG